MLHLLQVKGLIIAQHPAIAYIVVAVETTVFSPYRFIMSLQILNYLEQLSVRGYRFVGESVVAVEVGSSGVEQVTQELALLRKILYHLLKTCEIFEIHTPFTGVAYKYHHSVKVKYVLVYVVLKIEVFLRIFHHCMTPLL